MSKYELYEHKKSDTVKWVLTLIAFIVVGVLIAGLIAGWFDKGDDSLPVRNLQLSEGAAQPDRYCQDRHAHHARGFGEFHQANLGANLAHHNHRRRP